MNTINIALLIFSIVITAAFVVSLFALKQSEDENQRLRTQNAFFYDHFMKSETQRKK